MFLQRPLNAARIHFWQVEPTGDRVILPEGSVSTRLAQTASPLVNALGGDALLSAGQCLTIASDCVFDETGNPQPIDRSRQLDSYGIKTPEQASGVRTRVVNSSNIGVPRFNFQIDANALKDLAGSWTLGQLADRIQDAAVPA